MSKLILLWIILFGASITNAQNVKMLVIKYVGYDVLTPIRVDCDNFDGAFGDDLTTITVKNKKELREFSGIFNSLTPDSVKKSLDVRLKMEVYFDDAKKNVCANRFALFVDNKPYIIPKNLQTFIEKIKKKYSQRKLNGSKKQVRKKTDNDNK